MSERLTECPKYMEVEQASNNATTPCITSIYSRHDFAQVQYCTVFSQIMPELGRTKDSPLYIIQRTNIRILQLPTRGLAGVDLNMNEAADIATAESKMDYGVLYIDRLYFLDEQGDDERQAYSMNTYTSLCPQITNYNIQITAPYGVVVLVMRLGAHPYSRGGYCTTVLLGTRICSNSSSPDR